MTLTITLFIVTLSVITLGVVCAECGVAQFNILLQFVVDSENNFAVLAVVTTRAFSFCSS
jgi:hypothetical protein